MDVNITRLGESLDREEAKRLLALPNSNWGDEPLIQYLRNGHYVDGDRMISDSDDGVRAVLKITATRGLAVGDSVVVHDEHGEIIGSTRDPKVWKVRIHGKLKLVDGVNITKIHTEGKP